MLSPFVDILICRPCFIFLYDLILGYDSYSQTEIFTPIEYVATDYCKRFLSFLNLCTDHIVDKNIGV